MMKKVWHMLLALICVLGLVLTGCNSDVSQQPSSGETVSGAEAQTRESTVDFTEETDPEGTMPKNDGSTQPSGNSLQLGQDGKLRIAYKGNQSSVQYITSAAQLPKYAELEGYDEAFFEDHALVLVVETVNSGSVQVDISDISVDGTTAVVTLSHEMPGDAGTMDMVTWLLWVEVEPGLDCQWKVANPAVPASGEKY